MVRLSTAVVMAAALAVPVASQAQAAATTDIRNLAERFDQLQFARDRAGLEALVSPDLKYITGQGLLADREAFLAAALAPVSRLEPFDVRDRQITRLGEHAAAVTGLAVVRGVHLEGQPFEIAMRYLDLFERRNGRWWVVLVQVTPTAAAAPR